MTEHHDRDTVVVRDGNSGLATILGILLVLALLVAVWYFTLGPGAGRTTTDDGGTNVTTPSLELPTAAPAGS